MSVLAPSAYTTAQLLDDARRHLLTGNREPMNKLAAGIDADDTTLTFTYELGQIKAGAKLSIGLEDMYVWSADNMTAVVERAQFGTGAEAHASGDIAVVNSRFSEAESLRELNMELADLSGSASGLYRAAYEDITYNPAVKGYDLDIDYTSILDVRWRRIGPEVEWIRMSNYEVAQNQSTTDFASGTSITLQDPVDPGQIVRVIYRAAFAPTTALTDVVTTVTGLPSSCLDIAAMGVAIRLAAGREVKRNFNESQGDTRRAEEVPAGAVLGSIRNLVALRRSRIMAEAERLAALYPVVKRRQRGFVRRAW